MQEENKQMANFNSAVLTDKGINLLAKAQAGRTTIQFTKAATGNGSYTLGEKLNDRTALKEQKQQFLINSKSVINNSTLYLRFIITNKQESGNLDVGYYVKEVGIFANDPDEGEILYAIATAVNEQWDYLPAYNNLIPSTITMEFYTEVHNASTVNIVAGAGNYVTQEEFEEFKKKQSSDIILEDKISGKKYKLGIENGSVFVEEV